MKCHGDTRHSRVELFRATCAMMMSFDMANKTTCLGGSPRLSDVKHNKGLDRVCRRRSHNCAQSKDAIACGHSSSLAGCGAARGRRALDLVCPSPSSQTSTLRHVHTHTRRLLAHPLSALSSPLIKSFHTSTTCPTSPPPLLQIRLLLTHRLQFHLSILRTNSPSASTQQYEVLPCFHPCGDAGRAGYG